MFRVCVVLLVTLVATAAAQGGNYDDVPDFDWVSLNLDKHVIHAPSLRIQHTRVIDPNAGLMGRSRRWWPNF